MYFNPWFLVFGIGCRASSLRKTQKGKVINVMNFFLLDRWRIIFCLFFSIRVSSWVKKHENDLHLIDLLQQLCSWSSGNKNYFIGSTILIHLHKLCNLQLTKSNGLHSCNGILGEGWTKLEKTIFLRNNYRWMPFQQYYGTR